MKSPSKLHIEFQFLTLVRLTLLPFDKFRMMKTPLKKTDGKPHYNSRVSFIESTRNWVKLGSFGNVCTASLTHIVILT